MRILFIMLDGLRPDAITPERTPQLTTFIANGAATLHAQSVMPSMTLPCHTSIFHSVPPSRHGIMENQWVPMARPVIGLVEHLKTHGKRSAFVYNWELLRDMNRPGSLYRSFFIDTAYDLDGDEVIVEQTLALLPNEKLDFIFSYFTSIDVAGHEFGWMSDGYLRQVAQVDTLLQPLMDTLTDDMVCVIHADHGGHDRTHGTNLPEDMTIPWMIAGSGIRAGHTITQPVTLLETAPTIAHLLGVPIPDTWEGRVVAEVSEPFVV